MWFLTLIHSENRTAEHSRESCEPLVGTKSYLATSGRAVRSAARRRHRGFHMGVGWWPRTCSLCSSAEQPPQGPGCWYPHPHDPVWSGLEQKGRFNVTSDVGQCIFENRDIDRFLRVVWWIDQHYWLLWRLNVRTESKKNWSIHPSTIFLLASPPNVCR